MAFVTIDPTRTDADSIVDQSLMDDIRNDLNDLNTRLGSIGFATLEAIHDNFTANVLDSAVTPGAVDYPYTWDFAGGAAVLTASTANPHHALDLNQAGGANYSVVAASKYRMRFDLDQDHVIVGEFRHKSNQSDNTETWLFGFQDESLAVTAATCVTTQDNIIAWLQDATANKYKARVVKATAGLDVATALGDATAWTVLRIEITFSGATKKVEFFLNGSSVGSTTDTSKIPVIRMRPILGTKGGGGTRHQFMDYADFFWASRPLEP